MSDYKNRAVAIEEWLKRSQVSQAALARAADISATTVNQIIRGTYLGAIEENLNKIEAAIKHLDDKKGTHFQTPEFVFIDISKQIFNALNEASSVSVPYMLVLYGESGIGKTETIKRYVNQNKNAYIIEIDPMHTVKSILEEIASALDIDSSGSNSALSRRIIEQLQISGKMLIIDEAEYLAPRALDVIRRIHDKARVPVVLVGMPRLYDNIVLLRKKRGQYEQIANRMMSYNIGKPSKEDLAKIVLSAIADAPQDVVHTFIDCAHGTIRTLILMLQDVANFAHIKNEPITPRMIRENKASTH